MVPEDIYRALQHYPFTPVRLYLKDGRTYDITHRGQIVVGVTYVDIGIQARGEMLGICEYHETCSPDDVVRAERLGEPLSQVSK